jgi:hypothetical protein
MSTDIQLFISHIAHMMIERHSWALLTSTEISSINTSFSFTGHRIKAGATTERTLIALHKLFLGGHHNRLGLKVIINKSFLRWLKCPPR